MKKFLIISLLFLVALAGAGVWGYQQIQQFVNQPIHTQPDQLLTLERGTTGKKLAERLEQEQLIPNATLLPWLLKLNPAFNNVKAGTYSLNNVHNVGELLRLLNSGKEAQFTVRFTEGENWKQVYHKLKTAPHLKDTFPADEYALFSSLTPLLPEIKPLHERQSLEGWVYPDTYYYTPNSSNSDLLKRAVEKMVKTLDKAWAERSPDLPLHNPYEMLILASIVEKESGIAAERAKIASVFINRLKLKMKLQTDPTVIYGMGDNYHGNIRKKDLEQATPYNTYVIDGLPPTPIAMPSESALMAVAKPEQTDFLYFVADGTGGHKFSKTLAEHNRAVQDYLRWYRSQKGEK